MGSFSNEDGGWRWLAGVWSISCLTRWPVCHSNTSADYQWNVEQVEGPGGGGGANCFVAPSPSKWGLTGWDFTRFLRFVIFTPFNGNACKAQFQKCAFILLQTWRTPLVSSGLRRSDEDFICFVLPTGFFCCSWLWLDGESAGEGGARWKYSWSQWGNTTSLLIPSALIPKLHPSVMEKRCKWGNSEANGFISRTARRLTNGCHHKGKPANAGRLNKRNKLPGQIHFHVSDKRLPNTSGCGATREMGVGGAERSFDGLGIVVFHLIANSAVSAWFVMLPSAPPPSCPVPLWGNFPLIVQSHLRISFISTFSQFNSIWPLTQVWSCWIHFTDK